MFIVGLPDSASILQTASADGNASGKPIFRVLRIDNNGAERSLRGVAVGRRNWTFFGSDNGGRTAAVLTSLIATSKRHHLDPFAYLRDVFARISGHPQNRLEELLPDHRAATRAIVTS